MKKQIIVALSLSFGVFSFAQKKELKAVEKALVGGNYAEAKKSILQAESLMSSMDSKTKAKFYYLNGKVLYANGTASSENVELALESFDKVESTYMKEVADFKTKMIENLIKKGNDAYEKADYVKASTYFENAYKASPKNESYLYYAASAAVNGKLYESSLRMYEKLKELNYTGIEKQYYATNKASGKEELYDKTSRDLLVKSGTHNKPREFVTKSKKAEIVKNVALIYLSLKDNDKALAALKEAREENPDDIDIILAEANVNYKMGNTAEYQELLVLATEKEPNNVELQYNLGVIASESNDIESAKKYYNRAIELDSKYVNAYINLSSLVLNEAQAIQKEMSGLGNTRADNIKYDELKVEYQNAYKKAIPNLEKVIEIDASNLGANKTLRDIYSLLGETEKYKIYKAKVAALESAN